MGAIGKTTHHPRPSRPSGGGDPWLVVTAGQSVGATLRLDRREVVVGKDPAADLVLGDTGISRRHFKIVRAADGVYNLIDLDSTNGVRVNGVGVDLTILREHDWIVLGPQSQLLFTYDPDSVVAGAPAPQASPMAPSSTPLTERQLEIAKLVCQGLTNPAIAKRLGIRTRTVTSHLDHIYNRLGIGSRAELASYLTRAGLA